MKGLNYRHLLGGTMMLFALWGFATMFSGLGLNEEEEEEK